MRGARCLAWWLLCLADATAQSTQPDRRRVGREGADQRTTSGPAAIPRCTNRPNTRPSPSDRTDKALANRAPSTQDKLALACQHPRGLFSGILRLIEATKTGPGVGTAKVGCIMTVGGVCLDARKNGWIVGSDVVRDGRNARSTAPAARSFRGTPSSATVHTVPGFIWGMPVRRTHREVLVARVWEFKRNDGAENASIIGNHVT